MYQFKVEDMTCGGCAASVRNAVLSLPGVRSIKPIQRAKISSWMRQPR